MKSHFSSREEAHAEVVAAKTVASRKPVVKLAKVIPFPVRDTSQLWHGQIQKPARATRPGKPTGTNS